MAKKKTTGGAAGAPETEMIEDNKASDAPMVSILKVGSADKLSPRGDGRLTYRVGRMGDTILLQLFANESSGRFSKEWTRVEAIRSSLAQLPKGARSFRGALALNSAMVGRSSCNPSFLACVLKAEGVFVADADPMKKGMLMLASPDALDAWEKRMLDLKVSKDAEIVPLVPPKPVPTFAKKKEDAAAEDAPVADEADPLDDGDASGAEASDDQDDAA